MSRAVVLSAVRTPVGRYGGGAGRACGPTIWRRSRSPRRWSAPGVDPARDRGRLPRLREPGGRGQPQRRPDGGAAGGAARIGRRRDAEPALRLGPLGRRRRLPRDRRGRRRPVRGGRRRVDEPRAARDRQAGRRLPARRPDDVRHDARLALPEPGAWRRSSRSSRWARRARTWPSAGASRARIRTPSPLRSQQRWAAADFSDELVPVGDAGAATSTRGRRRRPRSWRG